VTRVALFWSGGKDAALALHRLRGDTRYDVVMLVTTFSENHDRVVMHGVRRELVETQAARMNLPLRAIHLPAAPDHSVYDAAMAELYASLRDEGITTVGFGDIFLEDLRAYREEGLQRAGLTGIFPLWGGDTRALVNEMAAGGIRATVVCADASKLPPHFLGREVDTAFVANLPAGVDPCGERGEYHTLVWDAPMFSAPVLFEKGDAVHRSYTGAAARPGEGFYFLDLLPA